LFKVYFHNSIRDGSITFISYSNTKVLFKKKEDENQQVNYFFNGLGLFLSRNECPTDGLKIFNLRWAFISVLSVLFNQWNLLIKSIYPLKFLIAFMN